MPTGEDSRYNNDSILLWNDKEQKVMSTIKFQDRVKQVTFVNGWFVAALSSFLSCTDQAGQSVFKSDTCDNPSGAHAVSSGEEFCIVTPHVKVGHVALAWFGTEKKVLQCENTIKANDSGVSFIAINSTGTIVAIASSRVSQPPSLYLAPFRVL